jgi:hypothetical protein
LMGVVESPEAIQDIDTSGCDCAATGAVNAVAAATIVAEKIVFRCAHFDVARWGIGVIIFGIEFVTRNGLADNIFG